MSGKVCGSDRARALLLHPSDNTATAVADLEEGADCPVMTEDGIASFPVRSKIPFGHKFAVRAIGTGEDVIKYGEVIGIATRDIAIGEHVHVHNVASKRGRGDLAPRGGGPA